MSKYILFDLDGTISDPKVGICTSVQHALKKMGIVVDSIDELTPFIGPPLRDSFKEFYGIKTEDMDKCISFYRERFSTIGLFENDIYPGMYDCLKALYEEGKVLVLCSSKPRVFVEKILDHFEILPFFNIVMGSELDGSRESKIDVMKECIRLLSLKENIDIRDCVMVGDRKFDIEAAIEMNMPNIGVSYGYGSKEELEKAGADKIAASVNELKEMLL